MGPIKYRLPAYLILFAFTLSSVAKPDDFRIFIDPDEIKSYSPGDYKAEIKRIDRDNKLEPLEKIQLKARLYFIQRLSQVDKDKQEKLCYALRAINPTEETGGSYGRDAQGYGRVDMNWRIVNRIPMGYYLILAHEFEHAIQLEGTPVPDRLTLALRFFDRALNPYPNQAIKTARKETEAFAGEWELLQVFSKAELAAAKKEIENSELSKEEKEIFSLSLEQAKEPRDKYVAKVQAKSYHRLLDHVLIEYIMKGLVVGLPVSCLLFARALLR